MSIQIGVNARTGNAAITNNERIFLQSSVHSNMITLKSPLEESRLWFDYDLTFGRSNTSIVFSKEDNPFAVFHPDYIYLDAPLIAEQSVEFKENVIMNAEVNIGDTLNVVSLKTCNVSITALPSSTNPLLALYDETHTPLLISSSSGTTYFAGSVGIGTNTPSSTLHIEGSGITSCNILTNSIKSLDEPGTEIDFNTLSNIYIKGHVVISETLTVIGGIAQNITEVDYLYVNDGLSSPFISLSNIIQNNNTIEVYHDISSASVACNILHVTGFDGIEYKNILALTPTGALGVGTHEPLGTLDVNYNLSQGTANIMTMEGVNNLARIVVDKNANVGIGTTQPQHVLHVYRDPSSIVSEKSMIALYNNPTPQLAPSFISYSNQQPVFQIGYNGSTTIGEIASDSNWGLVATSIKTPLLQTTSLVADPANGSNIYLYDSHLSNVGDYVGRNMKLTEFVSTSNLRTNFFFAQNFEIPGLEVFNNANHFSITLASMIHKGSNIVFSPNDNDIYRDPRVEGKVRIYAPNALTSESTVVGLNVIGPDRTISQVTSYTQPIFKLVYKDLLNDQTTEAVMKIENNAFRLTHSRTNTNVLPLQINENGTYFYRNVFIDNSGRMGLRLGGTDLNPTVPDYPFQMKGSAYFQTDTGASLMFLNGDNGRLGLNTITPSYTMHVEGSGFVRDQMIMRGSTFMGPNTPTTTPHSLYVDGSLFTTSNISTVGNIGVGILNPQFKLDVGGNLNFMGDLYQRGSPYISSQWTTNTQSIFINSNVGIGTTIPLTTLDVRGIISASSNIGIGTTIPLQSFHVQRQSFFNSNVGIGKSNPQFLLDVAGDLNFNGDLYQRGSRYISSQWTTTANPSRGIYIDNSNVGIGTTIPLYGFHVTLPCYFGSNVIFDSNVSVNGLLSTRGNIASISDQRFKTNLTPISDSLGRISKMTGYTYDRIDLKQRECGLIAQDVQKVLPEVVFTHPENEVLTISYGNLAALFVEGMKELTTRIDHLEKELNDLRALR
jgi:hypothetical protein